MNRLNRGLLLSTLAIGCSESVESASRSGDAGAPRAVESSLGRVAWTASPLGLTIENDRGELLLRSVGAVTTHGGIPYAAFGYATEAEAELAPPSFEPAPMPVPEAPAGSRFVATGIEHSEPVGDGQRFELGTDDPTGRRIGVTVMPAEDGALLLRAEVIPSEGVTAVFAAFECRQDEAFHGFGGRRESTDLRGRVISNWVHDYRFPDVSTAYYYPQPMFLSSAGYALWVETSRMATFRMASDRDDAYRIAVEGSSLDMTIAPRGGAEGAAMISARTGRHRLAPAWSMKATPSRTIQLVQETPESYADRVESDMQEILKGDLPIGAYAYEGWPLLPRERVVEINERLRDAGIHVVLYLRSFLSDDVAGTEPAGRIAEAIEKGYVPLTADEQPYIFPSPFLDADATLVDFTNPEARSWWQGFVHEMLELGADGFMNDFGEQVLPDMIFSDGSTGETMHNRYPVLQHEAARQAADAFSEANPDRQIYFFVRAGYTGSAAFENASFPGDESVDFDRFTGLPSVVPDMLNRALFGAWGFSTDIGGYADFEFTDKFTGTDRELFMRWTELAVFTTHFRVHNSALTGVRMPWSFDDEVKEHFAAMARLHDRVTPLIRRLWQEALESGVPPIRPLFIEDPSAEGNPHNDDQWLVGSDVLVAPVLARGATSREVWLPTGCWKLHGEGSALEGPATVRVEAPVGTLPWYTRCGTAPF